MPTKTCVYARVSTKKNEQAQSLETQKEKYTQFCEERGYELIEVYPDDGRTATNARRPEFQRMMYDCGIDFERNEDGSDIFRKSKRKSKYDLIIVKDPSRMSRSTVDGITAVKQLVSKNVNVLFENSGMSTYDKNWEFNLSILFSIAQNESQNLSSRVKFTKEYNARKGHYRPSRLPFGYVKDEKGKIIIDEQEAEIVKYIFNRYQEVGSFMIVRELNAKGFKTKHGHVWSEYMVNRMIKNLIYTGTAVVGKQTKSSVTETRAEMTSKDKHIMIPNAVPVIIPIELWEKSDQIRESRINKSTKKGRKPTKDDIYFNKLYCKECGSRFVRHVGEKKKINYMCQNRKKGMGCTVRGMSINTLDELFSQVVIRENTNIIGNTTYYKLLLKGLDSESSQLKQRIQEVDDKIIELEEENAMTLKAIKKALKDGSKALVEMFTIDIEDNAETIKLLSIQKESFNIEAINLIREKVDHKKKIIDEIQETKRINLKDKHDLLRKIKIGDYDCEFFFSLPSFEEEIEEYNSIFTSAKIETKLTFVPFTEVFRRNHKKAREHWDAIDQLEMESNENEDEFNHSEEDYLQSQEQHNRALELIEKQS